jgi:5-methylcytosine-specific restriction endonuclease McrA
LRDEYKCQYCNERFHTADLSLDHVNPRCMGGVLSWWVCWSLIGYWGICNCCCPSIPF